MTFHSLKSAIKRARNLGKYHAYKPAFQICPLAAAVDNYDWLLTATTEGQRNEEDYLDDLLLLTESAQQVNIYCSTYTVSGDEAAEYWLERFVWMYAKVNWVDLDILIGIKR